MGISGLSLTRLWLASVSEGLPQKGCLVKWVIIGKFKEDIGVCCSNDTLDAYGVELCDNFKNPASF